MRLSEANDHPWGGALACATLGTTLLAGGNRAEAIELLERGHAIAGQGGAAAYRLHCLAPLAEATGSPDILAEAGQLLAGATPPAGDAWVLGYEACLSVARAWLTAGQPERARAVLAPLLAAVERGAARRAASVASACRYAALVGSKRRRVCVLAAASPRLATPSLPRMLDTWTLAVLGEMNSSAAISRCCARPRPGGAPRVHVR